MKSRIVLLSILAAGILGAICMWPSHAAAAPPACEPDLVLPTVIKFAASKEPPAVGQIVYSASSVGLVWGYTCKTPDGAWHRIIAGGPWENFPKDWVSIVDAAVRGTKADRDALWVKYSTTTDWHTTTPLKSDVDMIWALLPTRPAIAAWKVLADPFRADKKRVVYNVVNGKRGAATTRYVDAGTPCDPVTTITEYGAISFASVLGNPALVARCSK